MPCALCIRSIYLILFIYLYWNSFGVDDDVDDAMPSWCYVEFSSLGLT